MLAVVFLLSAVLSIVEAQYSFISIGDWGGNELSPRYSENVAAVSSQMVKTIASSNAKMVLNTGDNVYYCGVTGVQDSQFQKDFVTPFASQMTLKWYSVLGYVYPPVPVTTPLDCQPLQLFVAFVLPRKFYPSANLFSLLSSPQSPKNAETTTTRILPRRRWSTQPLTHSG